MSCEQEFLQKLTDVKDFALMQGGYITKSQLQELFPDYNEEQQKILEDYLLANQIGMEKPLETEAELSQEEKNYLQYYLNELDELEAVSSEGRRLLAMNALNGDLVAKENLVKAFLKDVVDLARLYVGQGVSLEDLIGEGNVALAIAVDMIDCVDTPEDVESMLVKGVMNAMEALVNEVGGEARAEEKALSLVTKVNEKAKLLSAEAMRKLTVAELSKETGISQKQIREAIRISNTLLEYITEEENPTEVEGI